MHRRTRGRQTKAGRICYIIQTTVCLLIKGISASPSPFSNGMRKGEEKTGSSASAVSLPLVSLWLTYEYGDPEEGKEDGESEEEVSLL